MFSAVHTSPNKPAAATTLSVSPAMCGSHRPNGALQPRWSTTLVRAVRLREKTRRGCLQLSHPPTTPLVSPMLRAILVYTEATLFASRCGTARARIRLGLEVWGEGAPSVPDSALASLVPVCFSVAAAAEDGGAKAGAAPAAAAGVWCLWLEWRAAASALLSRRQAMSTARSSPAMVA